MQKKKIRKYILLKFVEIVLGISFCLGGGRIFEKFWVTFPLFFYIKFRTNNCLNYFRGCPFSGGVPYPNIVVMVKLGFTSNFNFLGLLEEPYKFELWVGRWCKPTLVFNFCSLVNLNKTFALWLS